MTVRSCAILAQLNRRLRLTDDYTPSLRTASHRGNVLRQFPSVMTLSLAVWVMQRVRLRLEVQRLRFRDAEQLFLTAITENRLDLGSIRRHEVNV